MRPAPDLVRQLRPLRLERLLAAMALLALLPFLAARLPSMTDLPGHIGRYAVMLDRGATPSLETYYDFHWRLVGNLGADLGVLLFGWLGAERAAWLVSAVIAPLTIGGIAAVSRALHGRVQPGAVAAACFAMANPLMFGFVNYCLSLALAWWSFALWIRLRDRRATTALAPLTLAATGTWLAHAMGWGVLALLVGGFELERLARRRTRAALVDAVVRALALVPPIALTLAWRGDGGALFAWGDDLLVRKAMNWIVVLRGEAKWIDLATPALLALAMLVAWRRHAIDWRLGIGALLSALACFAMPTTLFGSWGADERLAPAAVTAALLSLRWRGSRRGALAIIALAATLFALRTTMIARDWHRLDQAYASHLRALDRVPHSARIHAVVLQDRCHTAWQSTAYTHFASLAIGRRGALVNSQWLLPGAALLTVRTTGDPELGHDPSQMVDGFDCAGPIPQPLAARLAQLRTGEWDFLWVLATRNVDAWPGHTPVFRDANSALYRLPAG
ncbi:hypothetical protein F1C10_07975 [Sphingomonas sp. NBWT7]|nr:hypothetical protein F1C10_07975 [Sphingomonas sp. NBWT7]